MRQPVEGVTPYIVGYVSSVVKDIRHKVESGGFMLRGFLTGIEG